MTVREPKTIIRNLFNKYAKMKDNVVYAEKLFVINTVINYVFRDSDQKPVNKSELMYYGEVIDRYLKNQLDIRWEADKLVISEFQYNGKNTGE